MTIERSKPNYKSILLNCQKLVTDGKATVDLPRRVGHIFDRETWKHFTKSNGKPFESFIEFLTANQPYGLGCGQYDSWINAAQLWQLCSGHGAVRKALLPLAAEQIKPIAAPSAGTGRGNKTDSNTTRLDGRGAEYLLGRMARDAAKHPNGKAAKALARIKSGELKSVRHAAIYCGIIKVKDSDKDRCPVQRIKMYWKRANEKERGELLKWLETAEAKL